MEHSCIDLLVQTLYPCLHTDAFIVHGYYFHALDTLLVVTKLLQLAVLLCIIYIILPVPIHYILLLYATYPVYLTE